MMKIETEIIYVQWAVAAVNPFGSYID